MFSPSDRTEVQLVRAEDRIRRRIQDSFLLGREFTLNIFGFLWLSQGLSFWKNYCRRFVVTLAYRRSRACLSIFIYGETSKQFRVYGQTVYEETSKIKANTLSCNQRQGNQIAHYTKTPGSISSKITPADASRSCASFCIWSHYCVDAKRSAIAVSLPSTANLFLIAKQPRDKNSEPCQQILLGFQNERCQHNSCWTRTTLTGVSMKSPQCTNSKVILNEILYYICESWYEPFEKYDSRSPGWFKFFKS